MVLKGFLFYGYYAWLNVISSHCNENLRHNHQLLDGFQQPFGLDKRQDKVTKQSSI